MATISTNSTAVLAVLFSILTISQSVPTNRCSLNAAPPSSQDIERKLSTVDKNTPGIRELTIGELTKNEHVTHEQCPTSIADTYNKQAFHLKNIIPWVYVEYVKTDTKELFPAVIATERCDATVFSCPLGYQDWNMEEVTYHLELQDTCTENPSEFDMLPVMFTTVSMYSCTPSDPNPTPTTESAQTPPHDI